MNQTHDPSLRSWVSSANSPDTDFPIQNLPFGVFSRKGDTVRRVGVAIGDQIIDVSEAEKANVWDADGRDVARLCADPTLNRVAQSSPASLSAFRARLSDLLTGEPDSSAMKPLPDRALVPMADAQLHLPARIGDYTDFYASIYHATNVGKLFRPDNPLLPNYKYVPIGYHGRSSSIVLSGTNVRRPKGQYLASGATTPSFGPSELLDYEAEVGFFVGRGNALGEPLRIDEAAEHIFGVCLVNDWSARDIQSWEYQPLGPFLSKNFATTISPWVVTMEALEPFRAPWTRAPEDPQPLAYLDSRMTRERGAIDIRLEVLVETRRMRDNRVAPQPLSRTSYRHAYWTAEQLVAHHTVNGCRLRPGDLLGTGTLSGPAPGEEGSLVELTRGGKEPLLIGGDKRTFLEDDDRVILRGWCEKPGAATIGFGEASARVLPALD